MNTSNSAPKDTASADSHWKHIVENKRLFGSFALVLLGLFVAGTGSIASFPQAMIFAIFVVVTTSSYLLFLSSLVTELQVTSDRIEKKFVLSVILYFTYTMLLVLQFACAWSLAGGFGPADPGPTFTPNSVGYTDSIYFATTVFTTVGFGDYIPKIASAKWYFCFESLVSITHNVVFFSILLIRLTAAVQVGSAKKT